MKILFLKSLCFLALLPVSALFAQNEQTSKRHNVKLGIELGLNVPGSKLEEPERIRKSNSYNDNEYNFLFTDKKKSFRTTYVGLKPEFFIFRNRVGIASGLRLSKASSKLVSGKNDFLWKVQEIGPTTDYVRIKDIQQHSYLLGVPFEIRFFPNNREMPVQTYFKIGASFNYRIHCENQINFTNKAMEKYDDMVQQQLSEDVNKYSSFVFGAIGFKMGKFTEGSKLTWVNLEIQFPYILLTDKAFAFVGKSSEDFYGVGIRLSFDIPMGKNVPMGSK